MHFGPCLLEKDDPQFGAFSLRERREPVTCARYKVIEHHFHPPAVLGYGYAIHASFIDIILLKHLHNSMRILSQHAQRAKEVAVAQPALPNIVRRYARIEKMETTVLLFQARNVVRPDPNVLAPILFVLDGVIAQAFVLGRKCRVDEWKLVPFGLLQDFLEVLTVHRYSR